MSYFTALHFRGISIHAMLHFFLSEGCVVLPVTSNFAEQDFTCGTFDELIKFDALLELKPTSSILSNEAVYKRSEL